MNAPADEIHAAAGAYALDALDDLERARFEAHLARCATCRQDVADFRATARLLGSAVAEEPPARLRDDVLAAIRDVRQESPFALPSPRRRGVRPWVTALGAAAAIAIIGLLSVVAIDARNDRDDAQLLAQTLSAPDARTVELAPVDAGGAGRGRVVWSESEGRAVLVVDELPDNAADRAYELWFIEGETPRPAGVFRQDGGRLVTVLDDVPTDAQMIGVTEEPAGGSALPTGPILLLGETGDA
jgi:anti-sigma-K factor RskA